MKTPRIYARYFSAAACVSAAALVATLVFEPSGAMTSGVCTTLLTAAAGLSTAIFPRRERNSGARRKTAETARKKLLRPLPYRVGALRTEVRYEAAGPGALVGGDVYDVVRTPFGVRLLLGDAMGKGLSALGTAMDTLGTFRELAQRERRLSALAQRMDTALARRDGSDDFVTALLISVADGRESAEVVCCGHPPPLLIREGRATFVDALPPSPPLGLFDLQDEWCRSSDVPVTDDDRLLLYTDGVTEARDARGNFYPLAERAAALYDDDPGTFLDTLTADLTEYSLGRLNDDAVLLLIDFGDIGVRARRSRTVRRHSPRDRAA